VVLSPIVVISLLIEENKEKIISLNKKRKDKKPKKNRK